MDRSKSASGSEWFLGKIDAGPIGAERTCTVPAETTLVLPLHTLVWHNEGDEDLTVDEKRSVLSAAYSATEPGILNSKACRIEVNIGEWLGPEQHFSTIEVASTRLQSPPFHYVADPAAVADGFWFAFQVLPGQYILHAQGALCDFDNGFLTNYASVTYILDAH